MLQGSQLSYPYHLIENVSVPLNFTSKKLDILRNLTIREGDICVVSHPRSGSNWLTRIIVLLLSGGQVDCDKTARNSIIYADSYLLNDLERIDFDNFPSPRMFKMHLPYHLGLGGTPAETCCKYLYIARNPKDVIASYYLFEKSQDWWPKDSISWDTWIKMFIEGIPHRGPWSEHVSSWWKHASTSSNILFLKYEDLLHSFDSELQRIATFLERPLTNAILETVREMTNIDAMRKDPFYLKDRDRLYANIINKGGHGAWSSLYSEEQEKTVDDYYKQMVLPSGLTFNML